MSLVSINATRNAAALHELAEQAGTARQVGGELSQFLALYERRELADFFGSPRVTEDAKVKVLQTLTKGGVSDLVVKFLSLLATKNQLPLLGQIAEAYGELESSASGQVKVTVYTSAAQSTEATKAIEAELKKLFSAKEVEVTEVVDASVMGGIKIRIGDDLIDGSVENRLKVMKERLSKGSLR